MTKAFTLIELSVVLVIIGLIVGGVLVGRDLVKAAQIRNAASQLQSISSAFNTFKVKYNCIPGDCGNATDYFGANYITYGSCTGNGNEDGMINNWPCESIHALQSLRRARLMTYLSESMANSYVGDGSNIYFPGYNNSTAYFYHGDDLYSGSSFPGNTVTWANYSGSCVNATSVSPNQTRAIDLKMDDGLPLSGTLRGGEGATPTSNCVPSINCVGSGNYLSSDVTGCRVFYRIQ